MRKISDIIISIVIGVMLAVILFEGSVLYRIFDIGKDDHSISVEIADGKSGVVSFEHLGLVPGEQTEYTLKIKSNKGPTYAVDFEFRETEDSPLKDYVYVRMLLGDEVLCDVLLADAMDSGAISRDIQIKEGDSCEVTVIYYMPEEIGNEAENAEAHFDLYITGRFD